MNELPENPMTATFIRMDAAGRSDVFGIGCVFPGGLRFTLHSVVPAGNALDPALCKDYAVKICDELLRRGRPDLANETNWPSVAACMQRLIAEFNARTTIGPVQ